MLRRYFVIWWKLTVASSQVALQSRFGAGLFIFGKIIRFAFFIFFLLALLSTTKSLGGYSLWEVMLFYGTFNFLDTFPQFLFRNVYRFRAQVVDGSYDMLLAKPLPALFFPLFGGSDMLDIGMLFISIIFILFSVMHLDGITFANTISYLLLIANGFLLAFGFHVFVLGIGIMTTAVDNTIMLYRDLTQMGRFPMVIYTSPLREILTFVIPVGIMMTFPSEALLGLLSLQMILLSFTIGVCSVLCSLIFWKYALKRYSSASS